MALADFQIAESNRLKGDWKGSVLLADLNAALKMLDVDKS